MTITFSLADGDRRVIGTMRLSLLNDGSLRSTVSVPESGVHGKVQLFVDKPAPAENKLEQALTNLAALTFMLSMKAPGGLLSTLTDAAGAVLIAAALTIDPVEARLRADYPW